MAQHKKKPSGHQLEAIAKAHHKNVFLRKLKNFINCCCDEDIFSLIPPKFLEPIYILRCHSLTIVPAVGTTIPLKLLDYQRHLLSEFMKNERLEIVKNKLDLSIDDYFTVGLTAFYLPQRFSDNDFSRASGVRNALLNHCHDGDYFAELEIRLHVFFDALVWTISNLGSFLYWLDYDLKIEEKGKWGIKNVAEIHIDVPEITRIKTDGKMRPAIRLCWPDSLSGIKLITLKPSLLGSTNSLTDEPMPVYVQSHVLRRLAERIDSLQPGLTQYNMFESFRDPKVCYDNHHNLMIEYRIFETKAGYFRIDVIDGKVLVRTFLFLTQGGTPESHLLWKNTGLQKLDTKYLAIDKLSSFMSSEIGGDEHIRKLLVDSGCQSLIELYEKIDVLSTKHPTQHTCKLMIDYLGYNIATVPEECSDDELKTQNQEPRPANPEDLLVPEEVFADAIQTQHHLSLFATKG